MKLTQNTKRSAGLTLLELTVVILVLLSLIGILFFGARAWKKGADRAASILVIRNTQQAVRSYSNMYGHNPGETVTDLPTQLFGTGKFVATNPTVDTHPAGTNYRFVYGDLPGADDEENEAGGGATGPNIIPQVGSLYIHAEGTQDEQDGGEADDYLDYNPAAADITDW